MEAKIAEILLANEITDDVAEITVNDAGLQGAGFASVTKYITVKFLSPEVKPLHLFAKMLSSNDSHNQMLEEMKAFEKEATFLTKYVAAADKFCKERGYDQMVESLYPKCYYGDKTMIIMENLVLNKGYCLLNHYEKQDMEATEFALTTLATHHAVSYAMIQEEGGPDNFFKRFPLLDCDGFCKPQFKSLMGPIMANMFNMNVKILKSHEVDGKSEALAVLNALEGQSLIDITVNSLTPDKNDTMVLNHGDYWNNNMMFLKDPTGTKIIGHKAIDLQVTRYNSPALDLVYYLFSSIKPAMRKAHLQELLRIYHETLTSVTEDLGHPINLPFEKLYEEYKSKAGYAFSFGMCNGVGPGSEALKGFDVNKVDVHDWGAAFEECMQSWINKNPAEAAKAANDIVMVALEYKNMLSEQGFKYKIDVLK